MNMLACIHGDYSHNCISYIAIPTVYSAYFYKFMLSMHSLDTCRLPSLSRVEDNVVLVLDSGLPERILQGTDITFACIEGFYPARGVLTCGNDGIWQGDLPQCVRK